MLYLTLGSDFENRKHKTDALIDLMRTKRPEASLLVLDGGHEHAIAQLHNQIQGLGLFDEKTITKGLGLCENKEIKSFIFEHILEIVQSDNAFVFSESSLTKTEQKKIEESGGTLFIFESREKPTQHNLFYLGDLLLKKKKSQLWVGFQKELHQGISIEELFGIMVWQTKSLHLAKTFNQNDSGLKPFVYNKCSQSPWTQPESQNLHLNLINIYHQSRRGGLNLEQQFERLILGL